MQSPIDPPDHLASKPAQPPAGGDGRACPICGGPIIEIRAKLQCQRCHWIIETCCEGGRQ